MILVCRPRQMHEDTAPTELFLLVFLNYSSNFHLSQLDLKAFRDANLCKFSLIIFVNDKENICKAI
jgi:hypothetical protein